MNLIDLFAFIFSLAYRTEEGKPWVLPVVRKTEQIFANDASLNKEYLPVLGFPTFTKLATEMLLGADSAAVKENRVHIMFKSFNNVLYNYIINAIDYTLIIIDQL